MRAFAIGMRRYGCNFAVQKLIAAALIVLIVSIESGCDSLNLQSPTVTGKPGKPPTVNALAVKRVEYTIETATYFGTLQPKRQAYLGFGVGGEIEKMASVGERFKKGDQIATLSASELQDQRSNIAQNLEAAKSSQQDATVATLEAELATIDAAISQTTITAPFDCVVAELLSFSGGLIEGQKPSLKIVDVTGPNVRINLPRRVAQRINSQDYYYFVINGSVKQGNLLRKSVTEDPIGNTTLWFQLEETAGVDATFGATVECRFNLRSDESGFWIPIEALNHNGQGIWSIMVLQPLAEQSDNRVEQFDKGLARVQKRLVEVKQVEDKRVLIDGSINPGEFVIADGLHRVVIGQTARMNTINPQTTVARNPGTEP